MKLRKFQPTASFRILSISLLLVFVFSLFASITFSDLSAQISPPKDDKKTKDDKKKDDKSEKDKKEAFKVLTTDKERDLVDVLGKKDAKKYMKLMEDSLKPLIKKNKMLKYLL